MVVETVCEVCGANPCYGICPLNDPFGGDQRAENDDYEANSRFDYTHEYMGDTGEDYGDYDYEYVGDEGYHEPFDGFEEGDPPDPPKRPMWIPSESDIPF